MRTVTDVLREQVESFLLDAKTLFANYSVYVPHQPQYYSDTVYFVHMGTHYWGKLDVEGQRIASKLRVGYQRFADVLGVLLNAQDGSTIQQLKHGRYRVRQFIDQEGEHSYINGEAAYEGFKTEIYEQLGLLEKLHDGKEGEHIYVPDTNALIYNPRFDEWIFNESPIFTLVMMPTVLGELDKHKVNDRNQAVRDKAKQVISQVKDYRRRGNLAEGVTIRKGKISLRTTAVEPNFENTLSWLDKDNNDDRILAGFIEIMRQHIRCPVILVTADINLMNKADFAGLPCIEPPDQTSGSA